MTPPLEGFATLQPWAVAVSLRHGPQEHPRHPTIVTYHVAQFLIDFARNLRLRSLALSPEVALELALGGQTDTSDFRLQPVSVLPLIYEHLVPGSEVLLISPTLAQNTPNRVRGALLHFICLIQGTPRWTLT